MSMINLPSVQQNLPGDVVKTMTCQICGKLTVRRGGHQKYCPECASARTAEKARFNQKVRRHLKMGDSTYVRKLIEEAPPHLIASNFPSSKEEEQRMAILRQQGYSNAQIAKKIGRSYNFVLNHMGRQPQFVTKQSRETSCQQIIIATRARRANEKVMNQAAKHDKIREEIRAIYRERASLEGKMIRLMRRAQKYQGAALRVHDTKADGLRECTVCGQMFVPANCRVTCCTSCVSVKKNSMVSVYVAQHCASRGKKQA